MSDARTEANKGRVCLGDELLCGVVGVPARGKDKATVGKGS